MQETPTFVSMPGAVEAAQQFGELGAYWQRTNWVNGRARLEHAIDSFLRSPDRQSVHVFRA